MIERWYGNPEGDLFFVAAWNDGASFWSYLNSVRQAEFSTHGEEMFESFMTNGTGFFDLMLWYPCHDLCYSEPSPRDLISILTSPATSIRNSLEVMNGAQCVVLERRDGGELTEAIWLDVDRGYLPVYRRRYNVPLEFSIDEAVEVEPGVWMPVMGRRLAGAVDQLTLAMEYIVEVAVDDSGQYQVSTGPIAAETFQYQSILEPGTLLFDLDRDQVSTLTSASYSDTAQGLLARYPVAGPMEPITDRGSSFKSTGQILAWISILMVCGLAGFAFGRRNHAP